MKFIDFLTSILLEAKSFLRYSGYYLNQYHKNKLIRLALKTKTDKAFPGHGYVRIYDFFLRDRRNSIKSLCEIGLLYIPHPTAGGGVRKITPSLSMWQRYLPHAIIVGFDIRPFVPSANPRVVIIQGDQGKGEDLRKIIEVEREFDVIIDDALHASRNQQVTFNYLFKHLKSGGLFFIEDLHWQPQEFEAEVIPKTLDLLREFTKTGRWLSPLASKEERKVIESGIKNIYIFDSFKNPDITKSCDGIAVIEKR